MKTFPLPHIKLAVLSLFLSLSFGQAQTTAFTYQGRLNDNGSPFNGSAEFQQTLWDAVTNGNQIAANSPAQVIVSVTNGLFTLPLDFGSSFPGANRWLQLEVRTTIGPFTTLAPRQPLTPTPYAITASNLSGTLSAGQLSGAIAPANFFGTYSNALTLNNAANNFTGNGSGLTGVNADLLDGLDSTSFWKLSGNAGTTAGTHFLGTADNQALEIKVNSLRALRVEPSGGTPNVIIGANNNAISSATNGTVAGGSNNKIRSTDHSFIAGGDHNEIGGPALTSFNTPGCNFVGAGSGNYIMTNNDNSFVGGGSQCFIRTNSSYSFVGGGLGCRVLENSGNSAVVGGNGNSIRSTLGFVGGGFQNLIFSGSDNGAIAGGGGNDIRDNSPYAFIGGGFQNEIVGVSYATIPGGVSNRVAGDFAFAAGRRAKADHSGTFVWADSQDADFVSTGTNQFLIRASGGAGIGVAQPRGELHVGNSSNVAPISAATQTIIIENATENGRAAILALAGPGASDSTNRVELQLEANENERRAIIGTTSNHEIQIRQDNAVRMTVWTNGFVGIGNSSPTNRLMVVNARCDGSSWINSSDRNLKENFAPINPREVLAKIAAMPITRWNYKSNPGTPHIGPVAQDFKAAFNLGADDVSIATVDADGVALAAIQGLNQKLEEQRSENQDLKKRLAQLERLVSSLSNEKAVARKD